MMTIKRFIMSFTVACTLLMPLVSVKSVINTGTYTNYVVALKSKPVEKGFKDTFYGGVIEKFELLTLKSLKNTDTHSYNQNRSSVSDKDYTDLSPKQKWCNTIVLISLSVLLLWGVGVIEDIKSKKSHQN